MRQMFCDTQVEKHQMAAKGHFAAKLIPVSGWEGGVRCLCQCSHLGCNLGTSATLCAQRWAACTSELEKGYSVAVLGGTTVFI